MRYGLTIVLLGLATTLLAQTLTDIEKRLKLLGSLPSLVYDTGNFSKLPKISYRCDEHFNTFEYPEEKTTSNYHHVADLNNDGLHDLIYSGPCMPYNQTAIFLNDGTTLKLIHDYPGKLISIEKRTDKTVIDIITEACCCAINSDYIQVTIWNNSRVEKNTITFEGNTEIKVNKLHELKVKGILRSAPEINDIKKKDTCSDQIFEGNHLAHIDTLTTVIQLNQKGKWKLVLYKADNAHFYIGWIK